MTRAPIRASPWNIANALTGARLALVPVFGWLLLHAGPRSATGSWDGTGWRLAAAVTFFLAAATDLLDGDIARRRNLVTDVGKIADPIADKALIGVALVILSALGDLAWWVTIVIVAREAWVTTLRFWVIRRGVIAATRGGKLKTAAQSLAILLYVLALPGGGAAAAEAVMAVALLLTVITGVDYTVQAFRLRFAPPPALARADYVDRPARAADQPQAPGGPG